MKTFLRLALMTLALPHAAAAEDAPGYSQSLGAEIARCWNLGAFQSSAPPVPVTVEVTMSHSGKPATIRFLSSPYPPSASVTKSYEAARRAILRCGQRGFDLPAEDREAWRTIEITFDPQDMRIE